jgi:hypothetical protein
MSALPIRAVVPLFLLSAVPIGCGGGDETSGGGAAPGTTLVFDLAADLASPASFYDLPYPSDLRLTAAGAPDLAGMPIRDLLYPKQFRDLVTAETRGFPMLSAAYFRASAPLSERDIHDVIPGDAASPILLVDIDPSSPERGRLYPVVATILPPDDYSPANTLAIAPRPGFILAPRRQYAYVVRASLGDAAGQPLVRAADFAAVMSGAAAGERGQAANELYAPLLATLQTAGIAAADVAAATVFKTGDVVDDLAKLADQLVAEYPVEIANLRVDPDDGAAHDRYCEILGEIQMPQFQPGTPPFSSEGLFDSSDGKVPEKLRDETVAVVLTLPKNTGIMPDAGYPLVVYFHGSGSLSSEVVDRGFLETPFGLPEKGEGPAYVVAPHGFAATSIAMPLNPERLPGASEVEYLNLGNLPVLRDNFRQGTIEGRMFIDALSRLVIPKDVVETCTGLELPPGEEGYRVDASKVIATGNSMGGMYTNMTSAVEPRIQAAAPSGAGGFWTNFILDNPFRPDAAGQVKALILGTEADLTFLHPAIHIAQTFFETADPIVFAPRIGQRPLEGSAPKPVFQPVGKDDKYFPDTLFDDVALALGNQRAGDVQWESMDEALALAGLSPTTFPVKDNVASADGTLRTGVVAQYSGDGQADPHSIFFQLDAVKYQYGCFFETFYKTGHGVVPLPAPLGTPCAEE